MEDPIKIIGMILFFGAIAVFMLYLFMVYLPIAIASPTNGNGLLNAVFWCLICGLVATLGAIMSGLFKR